jgi:hypothetical protein
MMPDLSYHRPRFREQPLSMSTKRKRSGSLGLTEPPHRNFPEYSDLCAIFTLKNEVG